MSSAANLLATYLMNSLWQVPLVFGAAWLLARLVRSAGPAEEHTVWVGGLILSTLLPACDFNLSALLVEIWHWMSTFFATDAVAATSRINVITGAPHPLNALHLPTGVLAAAVMAYICSLAFFAGRLVFGLLQTRNLRQRATPLADEAAHAAWHRYRRLFSVNDAEIASADILGPQTLGAVRQMLLLPQSWPGSVAAEDLDAAIAHECAHMQRHDFAKNLLYQVIALPIAYHPLLWLLRSHVVETREMICDALAAEAVIPRAAAGRQRYARALLNLAALLAAGPANQPRGSSLHAIGIFDAHHFERRVMKLTAKQIELRGFRRVVIATACIAIGAGTAASALAFHRNIDFSAPTVQSETPDRTVRVAGGIVAGNILTKVNPVYPQEAKDQKISGAVILRAVIDKEGNVASLQVVSGPEVLAKSASDAVRLWKYKPYLLNGEPTAVDTTITVTYSLKN